MARVSEEAIAADLSRIREILRESPGGLDREAIGDAYRARYSVELPQRTLQRRLERLVVDRCPGEACGHCKKQLHANCDSSDDC